MPETFRAVAVVRSGEKAGATAFELAVQAGARVHFDPALGYVLERDELGRIAENVVAVGRLSAQSDGSRSLDDDAARSLSAR